MAIDVLILIAMLVALLLVPLGVPGVWIMTALGLLAFFLGRLGFQAVLIMVALATISELLEFLMVRRMSARYGGSRAVFWGAIVGGFLGVLVGLPVPVLGPVLAGLLGTFLGAAAVAVWEGGRLADSARVGWGTLLGRLAAMAIKGVVGFVILLIAARVML